MPASSVAEGVPLRIASAYLRNASALPTLRGHAAQNSMKRGSLVDVGGFSAAGFEGEFLVLLSLLVVSTCSCTIQACVVQGWPVASASGLVWIDGVVQSWVMPVWFPDLRGASLESASLAGFATLVATETGSV